MGDDYREQMTDAAAARQVLETRYASEFESDAYTPAERTALRSVREHVLAALSIRREFQANGTPLSAYIIAQIVNGPSQDIDPTLRSALAKFDERFPASSNPLLA